MSSTNADAAVEAIDLREAYNSEVVLDGASLSVPDETAYGFLGPNGAEKTAIMRILTGLSQLVLGLVRICDLDVSDREKFAPHVGYLLEMPSLYDKSNTREQPDYTIDLRDILSETVGTRIDDLLDQLSLVGGTDKHTGMYSKGTKQKTALIQSVLRDPDVLSLGEPTSGFDLRTTRQVRISIDDVADSGTAAFLSTYILPVAEAVADEVDVLLDGRVVTGGMPDEMKSRTQMGGEDSSGDVFLAATSGEPQLSGTTGE